ncbi:MAG: hypothetical protein F4169_15860 [Gammaproteobacteria bacterium]|nr:hypothetical protein [Gammaproteobacteria bacterium]
MHEWLTGFIADRELDEPDGRPLYAYRCTLREFAQLTDRLADAGRKDGLGPWEIRAFVLYASQWWQRRYSGGPWSWDPVLRDVGWHHIYFPDLYPPVRDAFQWWRLDLVRLSGTTRYLGTFAVQGGLPLLLVGEAGPVTAYLRAVVRHVARYRRFVDDPVELARDQQHLLRQRTLRREYVFRLAADLVDAVLDLREYVGQSEDLLAELDVRRPAWRESMPMDLDSQTARQLLEGLLREAKAGGSSGSDFGVKRFLVPTEAGWRLAARLQMPRSVERGELGGHLHVQETDLPPRMHVRTPGEGGRVVGLYGASGEHFHLMSGENNPSAAFWDAAAAEEFRLEFFSQDLVGEVKTRRGAALGELPWAFRADGEYALIGEGSVSDRAPELLVLLPEESEPSTGEALNATVAGRSLWRISEPAVVHTDSGNCVLNPASEQMVEEDYWLSGDRFYSFASTYPLFRGHPRLIVSKAEAPPRAVPLGEVNWRSTGSDWQSLPDGLGSWEVRHVHGGVLRHHGRLGLLPAALSLAVEPTSESEGHLVLGNGQGVGIACDANGTDIEIERAAEQVRMRLTAVDAFSPPADVSLRLRWPGARELRVWAPFPGAGARFLKNGDPLVDNTIAVDDLYGVRATAMSTDETQRFWIDGELKAEDAASVKRVAHFRLALRKAGVRHELALVEVDSTLRLLLGASVAHDARVSIRIVDAEHEYETLEVRRFAAVLKHDPGMESVLVQPPLEHPGVTTFEALPISRTDIEPITLTPVGPPTAPVCTRLPDELSSSDEPWLVVLRGEGGIRAEPTVVGGRSSRLDTDAALSFSEALALANATDRAKAVEAALARMVGEEDQCRQESDWAFVNEMLLCLEGVPSSASDLISALPRCPQALVRCLFRVDPGLRTRIWQLDDELPFSWLLIKRQIWRTEVRTAFDAMCRELRGVVEEPERLASEHVLAVLEEGAKHIGGLDTLVTDIGALLQGGVLSGVFVQMVREERDRRRQQLVNLLVSEDRWPRGYTRQDWSAVLSEPRLLKFGGWDPESDRWRQPTFDTPVAAAWCCFVSDPTSQTPFLVKRMRSHEPDWFDIAYRSAWYELANMQDNIQDRARKNRND